MHVYTQLGNMAEASKVSGEKYRRIFSEYVPVFVDVVSSAALSCNLNFSLKREQIHFFSEISVPCGIGLVITLFANIFPRSVLE